ncbi:MAG: response regulator transcription factor, partial [Paucibacter sp.]|nr:response regulator transcription factor [Roseateles sp.]
DDERPARDKLRRLLEQEPGVSAIEEARDGVEALERLAAFAPDVLLLDIQMPEISGLDVAASLPAPAPLVVFVTAYDQYAIQAFDANAIDYLLKPYDQQRLQRALARVRDRLAAHVRQQANSPAEATTLTASEPAPAHSPALGGQPVRQLLIAERGQTRIVPTTDIQWIETADNYVILHTATAQPLMRQTLAGLLDKLGPAFLRCHRSAAVRLDWIASVSTSDKGDGELLLHGGARVPLSRQFRPALMAALQQHASRAPEPPPSC